VDEVQQRTTVSMVVAAACFACRRAARVRPKSAGAAELKLKIRRPGGVRVCEIEREEREGAEGYLWGGGGARRGRGARVSGGHRLDPTVAEISRARAGLCERDDRRAPPISL
jgi:hypothetical protein